MGLVRKGKALSGIGRHRVASTAEKVEKKLDGRIYRAARSGASKTAEAAKGASAKGKQAALARAGRSEKASRMSAGVRRGTQELAALPLLSAVGDAAHARNGVRRAVKRARERTEDPLAAAQLAECLRRTEADLKAYRLTRTVTSPTSLLVRSGVRTAAAVGREDNSAGPLSARAARRAESLAVKELRRQPGASAACDALARVAMLDGRPDDAARFARVAAADGDAGPLVTLARAYLAGGVRVEAARTAALAARRGSSVGYEVLAELALQDAGGAAYRDQMAVYERLLGRVRKQDYEAYYGVPRSAGSFARSFLLSQGGRTWKVTRRGSAGAARAAFRGARKATRRATRKE
jgi:hypothetical protein